MLACGSFVRVVASTIAVAVFASLLTSTPARSDFGEAPPDPSYADSAIPNELASGPRATTLGVSHPTIPAPKPSAKKAKVRFPKPVSQNLTLKKGAQKVGRYVRLAGGKGKTTVRVLPNASTLKVGKSALAIQISPTGAQGSSKVSLDASGMWGAYGGGYGERLRLKRYPICALTTPQAKECQGVPIRTTKPKKSKWLQGTVKLSSKPFIVAASPTPSGEGGDYQASPQSPSTSWSHGGSTGGFGYGIDIPTPPSVAGESPDVTLGYSSQLPDAETTGSNGQSSWLGEGWDYDPGSITQEYIPCMNDKGGKNGDLCWKTAYKGKPAIPTARITLNGISTELIYDTEQNLYRAQNDQGWRIQRLDGGNNKTSDKKYWKVDDLQGNQYWFGQGRSPIEDTNSVGYVPVVGNDPGEPCFNSGDKECLQGTEFHLDRMEDSNGNTTYFTYSQEINNYYSIKDNRKESYTAAIYPKGIYYGFNDDQNTKTTQASVEFKTWGRCLAATKGTDPFQSQDSCPDLYNMTNKQRADAAKDFPDVPADLICDSNDVCTDSVSPTFFGTKRFASALTKSLMPGTSGLQNVTEVGAAFALPDSSTDAAPDLWLESAQRRGYIGPDLYEPMSQFTYTQLSNKAPAKKSSPIDKPLKRGRLTTIIDDTGSKITVKYGQSNDACTQSQLDSQTERENNNYLCFPVYTKSAQNYANAETWTAFNKYVVASVSVDDRFTGDATSTKTTTYTYGGNPAWAWQNSLITPDDQETWNQYRGYSSVDAVNASGGIQRSIYFRGMQGTKGPKGTNPQISVISSTGSTQTVADKAPLAGQLAQTQTRTSSNSFPVSWSTNEYEPFYTDAGGPAGYPTHNPALIQQTKTTQARATSQSNIQLSTTATKWEGPVRESTVVYRLPVNQTISASGSGAPKGTCVKTGYQDATITSEKMLIGFPFTVTTHSVNCTGDILGQTVTRWDNTDGPRDKISRGNQTFSQEWATVGDESKCINTSTQYDPWGRTISQTTPNGIKTQTTYSSAGSGNFLPTIITDSFTGPEGKQWVTSQSPRAGDAVVTKAVDQNGKTTETSYDALARPLQTKASGVVMSKYSYPAYSQGKIIGAAPYVAESNVVEGSQFATTYSYYNGNGQPVTTQSDAPNAMGDASGSGGGQVATATYYNALGLPASSVAAQNISNEPAKGIAIPVLKSSEPVTQNSYDEIGRITSSATMSKGTPKFATQYSYGVDSTTVNPPGSGMSRTVTDVFGRTTASIQYATNSDSGAKRQSSFSYDETSNMTSMSRGGQTWNYNYDQVGRRIKAIDPDTGTTTYTYNTSSSLVETTSPVGTVTTDYDSLQRPTQVKQGDTLLSRTEYDAPGNLGVTKSSTAYQDDKAYESYTTQWNNQYQPLDTKFDFQAGVVPDELTDVVNSYTQSYTYNTAGAPTATGYTSGGGIAAETVSAKLSNLGLPQTLVSNSSTIASGTRYNNIGQVTLRIWERGSSDNQLSRTVSYNPLLRLPSQALTQIQPKTGNLSTIADDRLTYNDQAQLVSNVDARGGQAQCYKYTGYNELDTAWTSFSTGEVNCSTPPEATSSSWNINNANAGVPYYSSWTFDNATGNLASRVEGNRDNLSSPATSTFSYGVANHANAVKTMATTGGQAPSSTSYDYNTSGARTSRSGGAGQQNVTWNVLSQPTKVTTSDGDENNTYGADGMRVVRDTPTSVSVFVGDTQFTFDKGSSAITAYRQYGLAGTLVGYRDTADNAAIRYSATDGQGSGTLQADPASLTSSSGFTRASYMPYGQQRVVADKTWQSDYKWLNKPQDKLTGLIQTDARLYDPGLQQFISPDPLLATSNPNPYSYAFNNPISSLDPSGLWPCILGVVGDCGPPEPAPKITKQQAHNNYMCYNPSGCRKSRPVDPIGHKLLQSSYGNRFASKVNNLGKRNPSAQGAYNAPMKWSNLAQPAIAVAAVTTTIVACAATAAVGCAIAGAVIGGAAGAADYGAGIASSGDDFDGGSLAASAGIGAALGAVPGVGRIGSAVKGLRSARQAYVDAARKIADDGLAKVAAGESTEAVARSSVAARNSLKINSREGLPGPISKMMGRRNTNEYGNPVGPTYNFLKDQGKTNKEIIERSGATNAYLDWLLGVK